MAIEIKIPAVGESIKEAVLAEWYKQDGEHVEKDEPLFVLETDKVTLEVVAETDGVLKVTVKEGSTVAVGDVVGAIDPVIAPKKKTIPETKSEKEPSVEAENRAAQKDVAQKEKTPLPKESFLLSEDRVLAPSVRRLVAEKNIDPSKIEGTGPSGRITKSDVMFYLESAPAGVPEKRDIPKVLSDKALTETTPAEVRKAMTPIRKRIAERLLNAKQNTAMLTTFNEIDMSTAMSVRSSYKEIFKKKHGVNLGFMSFFIMASVKALAEFPEINAFIDGNEIVYHNYQHIGVAIGSGKGLVVPVIRHAERLSFSEIEKSIIGFVDKINNNRLELSDLEGGTFTVSNGGVYGSLLSTPILNSPQSGILGMHKIEKRAVVVDDEIVIRPMMYVALSYDHRIIDGREAVGFLKRIKEYVENPERMLLEV